MILCAVGRKLGGETGARKNKEKERGRLSGMGIFYLKACLFSREVAQLSRARAPIRRVIRIPHKPKGEQREREEDKDGTKVCLSMSIH